MKNIKKGDKGAKLISPFITLIICLLFAQCEIQENFEYKYDNPGPKVNMTAWEYISQHDSLQTFKEVIELLGFENYFQDADSRTFIAPTNQAFQDYLNANDYASINEVPVPILRNTIRYHIVNEKVSFTDPGEWQSNTPIAYITENGQTMYLSYDGNYKGLINQGTGKRWTIITSNIEPTNGIIHVIDNIVYFSAAGGDIGADPTLETDTIHPVHDAFINGGAQADVNFGTDPLLKVKNVDGSGSYDRKTYLMFDLEDFDKEGIVTDVRLELGVKFTHAKGVDMNLFSVPDNTWTEMGLTWNNAPDAEATPIVTIVPTKVSILNFDMTDYYNGLSEKGLVSFMLDGEAGSNETDEFWSKDNPDNPGPMLIATLASGAGDLELATNTGFSVESGGVFVLSNSVLEITGAPPADLIYTIEEIPSNGWLIKGASILKVDDKFTQMDIDSMNLVYINNGSGTSDKIVLSARDKTGSSISSFDVDITIQ